MPQVFRDVDPRELRFPSSRKNADPYKLQRQIVKYGSSLSGMPTLVVYEAADGALVIYDGVTRATRAAMLAKGSSVPVVIVGQLRGSYAHELKIGDRVP